MKRIVFIDHAEERLIRRNLERAWIERTVVAPDREEPDPDHFGRMRAFRALPERDGRVLRVIYEASGDDVQVITAFLDRKQTRTSNR